MNTLDLIVERLSRQPSDIGAHLPTLRRLAMGCDRVVEFGVRGIVSSWALLAAHPKALTCVDVQHPSHYGADLQPFADMALHSGVAFQFVQADTRELAPVQCDFLFIDTLHTADQLLAELTRHAPGVTMRVAMHDTVTFGERGELPGSGGLNQAIGDFLATDEGRRWAVTEVHTNCNGLTVMERRS